MTKKLSLTAFGLSLLAFAPFFAFAQGNIGSVLGTIMGILNTIITLLIVLAVVYFLWAVVTYILSPDEDKKKRIINGLIGLFVMVAFWGIIRIVQNTFNLDGPNQIQQQNIPCVPGTGNPLC